MFSPATRVRALTRSTMLGSIPAMKFGAGFVAATIMLVGASVGSLAETGTVHLNVVNAGFIVSTGSGTGTLSFQGRTYRLSVGSTGFGTIGVAGSALVGSAYNMRTVADIAGTYSAVAAGLTVGGGAQVARFQNANGVILELLGVQAGLEVSLGSAGMTIALQ
ncbi:hypothetical protein [Roseiarcus sp.]|uniref:hypothetical protein n=1 Tax=Roseiarcus sp. TaxID=1969460 RepID=UPI003F9CAC50